MAWAHASAGHADPALLEAIATQAARRASEFEPRELANLAWAFATVELRGSIKTPLVERVAPALLDAVAAEAARRVEAFEPQELVVLLWAVAASRHPAPELLSAAAPMVAARAADLNTRALIAMAWAYATTEHDAPATHDALAAAATRRLSRSSRRWGSKLSPQQVLTMRSTLRSPELTSPLDLRVEALEDLKVEDGRSERGERGEPGPPSEGRGLAAGSGDPGAAEPVSWHARLLTWLGLQ
eukprot:scaffold2790_cov56-Phaeocystis_antarctica.AAC.4